MKFQLDISLGDYGKLQNITIYWSALEIESGTYRMRVPCVNREPPRSVKKPLSLLNISIYFIVLPSLKAILFLLILNLLLKE